MKIDVHVHMVSTKEERGAIFKEDALQRPGLRKLANARHKFPALNRHLHDNFDDWYVGNLTRKIRESKHIDKAVLLAFDGVYHADGRPDTERTVAVTPNDIVLDAVRAHPGELLFGASINPYRIDAIDELERCASLGAVLVKWVPNSQGIDPSDERIIPFYERMARLGLPLLSHTGYEHAIKAIDQTFGDPRRLSLPLECGVKIIAGHAGSSGTHDPVEYFDFFLEMLKKYDNLYGDLAALTWENRRDYLRRMIRKPALFDRMVQGTDYPVPVVPAFLMKEIGLGRALSLQFRNYFDAEAETKLRAGVPESVFTRAASLLPIKPN